MTPQTQTTQASFVEVTTADWRIYYAKPMRENINHLRAALSVLFHWAIVKPVQKFTAGAQYFTMAPEAEGLLS